MAEHHSAAPLTDAIIDALTNAGLVVGDGIMPLPDTADAPPVAGYTAGPGSAFIPYVVVHSMPGGPVGGTIDSGNADVWPLYSIRSHGATRSQCEQVADVARSVLLTARLVVAGREVAYRSIDWSPGCLRDDEAQPPVWFAAERCRFFSTPA